MKRYAEQRAQRAQQRAVVFWKNMFRVLGQHVPGVRTNVFVVIEYYSLYLSLSLSFYNLYIHIYIYIIYIFFRYIVLYCVI